MSPQLSRRSVNDSRELLIEQSSEDDKRGLPEMSHMFEVSRDSEYDISKEWHDINQIAYDGQNESKQSPSLNKSSFDRFASRLLNKLETSKSILTNFVTDKSLVQQSTPRNGTTSGNMEAPVIFGESDTRN